MVSWYDFFEPDVPKWESHREMNKLIGALKDGDLEVRCLAYDALGRIGGEEALSAVLKALSEEKETPPRQRAAVALSRIGGSEALRVLCDDLLSDESWEVRAVAVRALCNYKQPNLMPIFCYMLQDDHEAVVAEAIYALSCIGHHRATSSLHRLFDHCGRDVKELAASAINAINMNKPMDWPTDEVYFFTYVYRGRFICECYSYKLAAWRNYLRRRWRRPFAREWGIGYSEIGTLSEQLMQEVVRPGLRLELCDCRA